VTRTRWGSTRGADPQRWRQLLPVADDCQLSALLDRADAFGGRQAQQLQSNNVRKTSATVGTAGYTNTFMPASASALSPVCLTVPATIKITKTDAAATGDVNESISIQPSDNDGNFRIADCKYIYNLATSSLLGAGTYTGSRYHR
jgi:hypothetical protein